ncbi:Os03g0664650 [Oryza sativa Japonica Group]|uniref:Os03g0664650 protein n=1 Tax=Oryza sativa subsp. japonica TaxID=39947 RepID=A0A0P0W115_ORYSJ|nr:hypothetical protein EE612_019479 [Oryza sativa]BAS85626.1 Os03g0664650 [Oryza sativa Japonica Group]
MQLVNQRSIQRLPAPSRWQQENRRLAPAVLLTPPVQPAPQTVSSPACPVQRPVPVPPASRSAAQSFSRPHHRRGCWAGCTRWGRWPAPGRGTGRTGRRRRAWTRRRGTDPGTVRTPGARSSTTTASPTRRRTRSRCTGTG